MKIALIRKRYSDFGGAERYVAELARCLISRGHEVHIYAESWSNDQGVQFHRVPRVPGPNFIQILGFAHNTCRMMQQERYDIIHSFERTYHQDVYRAGDGCHREWLKVRSQGDPFLKRHTYLLNPLHQAILTIEKKLYSDPRLKLVIANSERVKNEIVRHYHLSPEKIHVIYNGITASLLNPVRRTELPPHFRIQKGERIILFVGSGFERKNLATLIKAVGFISDPSVNLWVVGKDAPGFYRRLAHRLGVERQIMFFGPQVDPIPYYTHAHAFVLPSIYEPFGQACLEASAFGLPVITSRACGFSELVHNGENGFIVENPLDYAEIAEKLLAALRLGKLPSQHYPTVADNVLEMVALYEMIRTT
jgi:UDP-glucose:(heptosyl)LPS alpha-1,3-glucosyltransferase